MAQMVQHVIALAVNDAAFQHRVIQARPTHDFFRCPFRFMIRRTALRSGPQKTDQSDLTDASLARSFGDMTGAVHVNTPICLRATLTIDSSAVRNRVAAGKRFCELLHAIKADRNESRSGELSD